MKTKLLLVINSLLLIVFLTGCSTPVEAVKDDSTPPANYKPLYVSGISRISEMNAQNPVLTVSRVDASQADLISIYMNILNSDGIMLTNALEGEWLKKWCSVSEEVNGKTYKIDDFKLAEIPGAIVEPIAVSLVMDHSGSIGEDRANIIQAAAADLIKIKNKADAVSIVKYDDKAVVEVPLTTEASILLNKLTPSGLTGYGGKSSLVKAIMTGIDAVKNAPVKSKIVIVYTDGTEGANFLDSLIEYALDNDVIICAIDFGRDVNENFLKELAVSTGGTYNHMYLSSEFSRVYADIYSRLRHAYILQYRPVEYGQHTVSIKFCMPQYEIETFANFNNTPEANVPVLLNINFEFNKYDLKASSERALQTVVDLLIRDPLFDIEIHGHTDNVGDKSYNLKLSQQRADAVKTELIKRGIDGNRIKAIGFGDTKPVADNKTEEGRAENRRTEFIIIQK